MARTDLSNYNLGELKGLLFDVEKELKQRERRETRQARERILAIARSAGVSVEELLASQGGRTRKKEAEAKAPPAARYRNPHDASQTWSGRGRKPGWVSEALAAGKRLDDLLA